jgi:hypothetical protein
MYWHVDGTVVTKVPVEGHVSAKAYPQAQSLDHDCTGQAIEPV